MTRKQYYLMRAIARAYATNTSLFTICSDYAWNERIRISKKEIQFVLSTLIPSTVNPPLPIGETHV